LRQQREHQRTLARTLQVRRMVIVRGLVRCPISATELLVRILRIQENDGAICRSRIWRRLRAQCAEAVSIGMVSAFPARTQPRRCCGREAATAILQRLHVAVFLPGMLLHEGDEDADSSMRSADKSAASWAMP